MKIMYKLLVVLLVLSLVPLSFLGYSTITKMNGAKNQIGNFLENTLNHQAQESMADQAGMLAVYTESQLQTYMNDIVTFSKHPALAGTMRSAKETGVIVDNTKNDSVPKDKKLANFYPSNKDGDWQELQTFFLDISKERTKDIELIRVFYDNGYIVNGVQYGKENNNDFKGDKSWFKDTMDPVKTQPTDYYVSPISIARQTNTSVIRYMTPITVDGQRLGLIAINFKSSSITNEIQNYKYGKDGYAMLIDLNYENAEGKISDFPVVVSQPTEDGSIYYINESQSAPLTRTQLVGDEGFTSFQKDGKNYIASYKKINWQTKEWYIVVAAPEDEITQIASDTKVNLDGLMGKTMNSIFVVIIISIIITLIVGYVFASRITRPIRDLTSAGNKIANGEFNTNLPVIKSKDEISDLAATMEMLVAAMRFLKQDNKK